uniref:unspecific monooxygenase n=1 Tax=Maruca vitrata TaxID=497515 RepID=A0AAU7N312_MARVT
MIVFLSLLITAVVAIFVFLCGRYNKNYWKKRGVVFHDEDHVMGPFWQYLTTSRPLFKIFHEMYLRYPTEPAIAFGSFFTPSVYIRDKTNVQYVMQSPLFLDRGFDYNEGDLLAENILFLSGIKWKLVRQKMTPLFTTIKLKNMYYIMDKSAKDFVEYLKNNPNKTKGHTFDTLSTFCCAAIGGAVFGINSKSTFDSPFLSVTRGAFEATFWSNIRFTLSSICPLVFRTFNIKFFKEYEEFFIGAIKQVLRHREKEGVKKYDFADVCLSIQKEGTMINEETNMELEPTDELLAAQAFFFFIAGVEPAATGIFGALIEIGKDEELQKRVQAEIDDVFNKHNGELNYEAITEMEYLEKVLSESLRMYPPIGFLTRRCTEDTVLPVGNIPIEKGTKVYTPIYEYHYDPQYFKDPETFDPERFSEDAKSSMGITYMPFGYGHRKCIGARYAILQVKAGLAHLLHNFDVKTHVLNGGMKYRKDQVQVRMANVNVEYLPRSNK